MCDEDDRLVSQIGVWWKPSAPLPNNQMLVKPMLYVGPYIYIYTVAARGVGTFACYI